MARTESIEIFSGYRSEGKKRSLTEAYYVPPFGYSSGLKIGEFSKRRRTESSSGVTSATYTYSAPSPTLAPTVFTPAALKAMEQQVRVVRKPSYESDLEVLLKNAQDHEMAMRAAFDAAAERELREATKRAAILASDLLDAVSRGRRLSELHEEQKANAAEIAKVVQEAGATTPDVQRKLAESRAQADAAEAKKDALLHGLSRESLLHCPPHDDVELAKLLVKHEACLKKVNRLRAQWYRDLLVLEWHFAGDLDYVSSSLQTLASSDDLLPPHVMAVLSAEDAKRAQETGRARAKELHLSAEARYREIVERVGTLTPCLDIRPSTDARELALAEEKLVRVSAMISAFNLFRTAEANKRMDAQRARNEYNRAMSDVSKCEELLADAEAHEQAALEDQEEAEQAVFETGQDIEKVVAEMIDFENRLVDPEYEEEGLKKVVTKTREAWNEAVLTVARIKEHCDSAVLRTACVWP
ncbi:hypothetical protein Esi_0037_0002 [Ectocarpus siliculosus]|uniref:Uncharacterized protein n=1 Tax=Ectocarpus siliculosus TaxID=2880 RepID=D8LLJ4_ECTSI|nr:hypothetical protein Esi_0037_0002 [Ectocarpus siliculosus]|eukprot:CBN74625.1 hypothetical protein Esi_0037_0002 [Ectocarpus siliculosus]